MALKNIIIIIALQVLTTTLLAFNPDSLISTANNAYNKGLYDSVLNTYNQVISRGIESGELYYNMGNAFYKNNDIASAILYYEKAKKLIPNDEEVQYNLNIANSMIVDKIDKVPELFYNRWWNFVYNILGTDAWTIFALISFTFLIVTIGLFIISKKRRNRKLSFYIGLIFLITSIVSFTLTSQKYYFNIDQNEAIVFTSSITVKSSPTQNAVDLFVIHEGTKVKIIDKIDDWVEIKIQNGSIGWLPEKSIKKI
ncbi:MAG: tetratricopeptide repeat protein [Bacteroidetes bacterium]|nr:tetratricopeptide repeat protein [Bacteroidota bacterium]MBL6944825.1 tetratricopeptide repeat protein [Bacteroidales bacterium]